MHGEDADCDSMLLISLCYGKQTAITEARAKEDSASADGFSGSAFSDEVMLNDVEQLKHLLPYDLGLAEKDCAWHSPLLAFAQLKSLNNMRIRTKESEDKRREKWMNRNQGYLDRREESRHERQERRDSVPPLRRDSDKHVGQTRSPSVSRARSNRPPADVPTPPPAPVRAPATPPKATTTTSVPVRYKAAPAHLKQEPTSTSTARAPVRTPPVKAPPAKAPPVPPPGRSPATTRLPSRTPEPPKARPPWRERSQKRPVNVPEPPAPPSRMTGSQWLSQGDQSASSSSTGHRGYGWSYERPAYYRTNPHTQNVEYVPGYVVPQQRWVQKFDGTWLDMIPQSPDQSIFFHQSGELRRRNEMSFYGYTFSMGL